MHEDDKQSPAGAANHCRQNSASTLGQSWASDAVPRRALVNDENAAMPTAANVVRSLLSATGDATGTPSRVVKAAGAQITVTAGAATHTAREAKSTLSDMAVKAGKKLDNKADSPLGPYGSLGTCVPSDLDPLAVAVHAGLDLEDGRSGRSRDGWGGG